MDGSDLVALRDPAWPPDRMVLLSHSAVALVSFFDGQRDRGDVQAEFMRHHGELVAREDDRLVLATRAGRISVGRVRLGSGPKLTAAESGLAVGDRLA